MLPDDLSDNSTLHINCKGEFVELVKSNLKFCIDFEEFCLIVNKVKTCTGPIKLYAVSNVLAFSYTDSVFKFVQEGVELILSKDESRKFFEYIHFDKYRFVNQAKLNKKAACCMA
jgi:hypothetical protein